MPCLSVWFCHICVHPWTICCFVVCVLNRVHIDKYVENHIQCNSSTICCVHWTSCFWVLSVSVCGAVVCPNSWLSGFRLHDYPNIDWPILPLEDMWIVSSFCCYDQCWYEDSYLVLLGAQVQASYDMCWDEKAADAVRVSSLSSYNWAALSSGCADSHTR